MTCRTTALAAAALIDEAPSVPADNLSKIDQRLPQARGRRGTVKVAIKKSELYSSLWKSCDALRGGMDASQYKDYVLVVLFVKYVSDRALAGQTLLDVPAGGSFADLLALKNDPEIGDKANKVIAKLAAANDLQGVIDLADFNDPDKLGRGKEMVDKLSELFSIFDRPELNFSSNVAEGDDLLGDAYEYLMRNFATESGKSKGQFYTPAEVSRILATVVGAGKATSSNQTIYDPTCGSGSLLLKAHAEAQTKTGLDLAVYGQEMDNATAALSRMNMILHGVEGAEIWQANTLSDPHFLADDGSLMTFDFVVANPPFSTKSWMSGVNVASDPFDRFKYGTPPPKNGDYAFLLHMIASLKTDGKAAVILPHGVLSRPNAEATIRRELIKRGLIKAVIALPPNLFYGTGIPAVILVIDKEGAGTRDSVFFVDASRGFRKEGPKNRLRARDIHQVVDAYDRLLEIDGYSRSVPISEIESNDYTLLISRYVTDPTPSDRHDLSGHLNGGIPRTDVEQLGNLLSRTPELSSLLFTELRPGFVRLIPDLAQVPEIVRGSTELAALAEQVKATFDDWAPGARERFMSFEAGDRPKSLIAELAESILSAFEGVHLVDGYAAYQVFMDVADEMIHDDLFAISASGWLSAAVPTAITNPKDDVDLVEGKTKKRSALLPRAVVVASHCPSLQAAYDEAQSDEAIAQEELDELIEEYCSEDGLLMELAGDSGKPTKKALSDRRAVLAAQKDQEDEAAAVASLLQKFDALEACKKRTKQAKADLDASVIKSYSGMSDGSVRDDVVDFKWLATLESQLMSMARTTVLDLQDRVLTLGERYAMTWTDLKAKVQQSSDEVASLFRKLGVLDDEH